MEAVCKDWTRIILKISRFKNMFFQDVLSFASVSVLKTTKFDWSVYPEVICFE